MKKNLVFVIPCLTAVCSAFSQTADNTGTAPRQLNEIVVSAARNNTRLDSDGFITTISGTPLGEVGTVADLLGYIPGVLNNNGSVEVVGKGRPVIYINGRKLYNTAELEQLQSSRIKEVKVITNPGARYGSSVNAVIRITTVREYGDGFALDSRTVLGYRDYANVKEQLGLNYRTGGLDIFGFMEYADSRAKGTGVTSRNIWGKQHIANSLEMSERSHSRTVDGKAGFNYITPSGHSFGAFYQTVYTPVHENGTSESAYFINDILTDTGHILRRNSEKSREHLIDGYYSGNWGKWTADITFDFMWKRNRTKQDVVDSETMRFLDRNNGRMLAGELHLSREVLKGRLNLGAEFSDSDRKDIFDSEGSAIGDNDNRIREDNIGVYAELIRRFGPLSIQAGLRYEHIASDYYEYGKKIDGQSGRYDILLPSAVISFPVKKTMIQIGYSRKYYRPLYSQLSSTVYYYDKYTCETGNPMLKSTFSDNVSLNVRRGPFMLIANYKHQSGRIITACLDYPEKPDITLFKKENSPYPMHNLEVIASVSPGTVAKFYYPVFMAGIVAQFYKTDYQGRTVNMNNPMAIVRFNNIFMLPAGYRISADFSYRSEGDGENVRLWQPTWQINLAASKSFGRHWDIKLAVNDIFNTASKSGYTIYSGNHDISISRRVNTRGIELTAGYKFNTTKSKYKGKGAALDERERF